MSKSRHADADLSANERLEEIASLLAMGVLRLQSRVAQPGHSPPQRISHESTLDPLEVPLETVLSVHTG